MGDAVRPATTTAGVAAGAAAMPNAAPGLPGHGPHAPDWPVRPSPRGEQGLLDGSRLAHAVQAPHAAQSLADATAASAPNVPVGAGAAALDGRAVPPRAIAAQPAVAGVVVRPVRTARDLERFIDLPWRIYRDIPQWVPPLKFAIRSDLTEKNPYFDHAQVQHFLAERAGVVVGRISAHLDQRYLAHYPDEAGGPVGFFGWFECEDDRAVAGALFRTAESWLRERGAKAARGPLCFSIHDANCGFLVEGFEYEPPLLMSYNPRYYEGLAQACGYDPVHQMRSYTIDLAQDLSRWASFVEKRFNQRGYSFRPFEMRRFQQEQETLIDIMFEAFQDTDYWRHVPLTREEIRYQATHLKQVIDPRIFGFGMYQGKPVGTGLVIPDLGPALKKANGRLFPFGWWHLLRGKRKVKALRGNGVAVRKEHRFNGLGQGMVIRSMQEAQKLGYATLEYGWIDENNPKSWKIPERFGSTPSKIYRILQKAIDT